MLRSFARHFNETVFRGPENEGGGAEPEGDTLNEGGEGGEGEGSFEDPAGTGEGEGGDPDKPLTVREQLKKSIEEANADEKKRVEAAQKGKGKTKKEPAQQPAQQQQPAVQQTAAPESLPKEAKADWDKTPPAIQAAFVKREQDMAAGVAQLKQRYDLIDQAIAPHTDALRQMNATPGEAVSRMFLWFKALAGRPQEAFPELARAMGIDFTKLYPQQAQQMGQQAQQQAGQQPAQQEPIPAYVADLQTKFGQLAEFVQNMGGRFGSVEQNIQTQNEARTRENLSIWSKDKPYFEEVRQGMAQLIQTGIVPLKPDGQVDLDTAYERAIYLNPDVRAKVLAQQQQANQAAQQQTQQAATTAQAKQVASARKAAVSLPASSPPGVNSGQAKQRKPGERTSVRDSLKAAMAELRDQ